MILIPTPFTTGADDTPYCVVATFGRNNKREDISGAVTQTEAIDRAASLKGDAYYKRAMAVPYPYKPKKAKKK